MLIIDDKILIVHMRKCGGTSFCGGLIRLLPASRVTFYGYTPEGEERSQKNFEEGKPWKHSTARDVLKHMSKEKFDSYWKIFVSVRPFTERVASFYFHAQRQHARDPQKYVYIENRSFSEYIRSKQVIRESVVDFCADEEGRPIVDELVRFEDLGKRYASLAAELGFPDQMLPKLNSNPEGQDYNGLYTAEDREVVDGLFSKEIEFLKALGINPA